MDSASLALKPFIEHVYELRRRALICVVAVIAFASLGYTIHSKLLFVLQKPLGEVLYYTSPAGGFSFVFKLCTLFGFICALPVIFFNLMKFISPLFSSTNRRSIPTYAIYSCILAFFGVAFAYTISLPAALHFLANFGGESIQSLITADEYFSFALAYLVGFAFLFQLPLIILTINQIRPQSPGELMRYQRYVILGSFILAAVLTPTPDFMNQTMMATPIIVLYQLSIVLVWFVNRHKHTQPSLKPLLSDADVSQILTDEDDRHKEVPTHSTLLTSKPALATLPSRPVFDTTVLPRTSYISATRSVGFSSAAVSSRIKHKSHLIDNIRY